MLSNALLMTVEEARACIDAINGAMTSARASLWELYHRKGWQSLGYSSWRECVVAEFEQSKSQLYRQLEAAEIEHQISPRGEIGSIPERHLRPLAALTPDQQREAWRKALDTAPNGKITGTHVQTIADHYKTPEPDPGETIDTTTGEMPIREPSTVTPQPTANRAYKNSSESNEWYTPRWLIEKALTVMGGIDLDPASSLEANKTVLARQIYTAETNGLDQPWSGRVWLNPPYGNDVEPFVDKLLLSVESGEVTEAILLVAARTDTAWFRKLRTYPRCFIWGRLKFINGETGEAGEPAGFPSMVVYMGPNFLTFVDEFKTIGDIYTWWTV